MEALKRITTVKNRQVLIEVPDYFEEKEVEVIVLTAEPGAKHQQHDKKKFLEILRNGPTLSEEELQKIDEVKKEFRNWTLDEF